MQKGNRTGAPWEGREAAKEPASAAGEGLLVVSSVSLELPYPEVTGNHAVRHARGRHYRTDRAQAYRTVVGLAVASYKRSQAVVGGVQLPLPGPLAAEWVLAPPDRRARDVDNVRKEAADALTHAGFWADDSCKVLRQESFSWTDPVPGGRILLTVRQL